MAGSGLTFPLVSSRRVGGVRAGELKSSRRGSGVDLAGSRPYRPGDDVRAIDRHSSARLSTAYGRPELVVRQFHADEAVPVLVVTDGRPEMALFPEPFPWLAKPAAVAGAVRAIATSAVAARCPVRLVAGNEPPSAPIRSVDDLVAAVAGEPYRDRPGSLERRLAELARASRLRTGSFVFVLSDFVDFPDDAVWQDVIGRGLDPVPVIVQDPQWEQSFPAELGGTPFPAVDPETRRTSLVLLSRREAHARRRENEERLAKIRERLERLGLEPVLVSTADPNAVHEAFLTWSDGRRRGSRWIA
jgi:uncharacterized protein (DUF58 family)